MRAAYAALGGATWVGGLARLLGGGSGVLAPAATKAVALGIGAAAVTGGAVVAPHLLTAHRGSRPDPVRRALVVAPASPAPVFVPSRPIGKPVEASFREDRHRDSGDSDGRLQGDSSSGRATDTGDRDSAPSTASGATTTAAGSDGRDSSSSDGTTTTTEQADGMATTQTSVVAVLDTSTTTIASTDGGGDGMSGGGD